MKKQLGKLSILFLLADILFVLSIHGKYINHAFTYATIFIFFLLSVLLALYSEGVWKKISLTLLSIIFLVIIGYFLLGVLAFL